MIPVQCKFGVLAMQARAGIRDATEELAPGLSVSDSPPVELPSHWKEWLGEIEAGQVDECSLFVVATVPSDNDMQDHQTRGLDDFLSRFYAGIELATIGVEISYARRMLGANLDGEPKVSQTGTHKRTHSVPGLPYSMGIALPHLRHANQLAERISALRERDGEFRRLWRGLRAFSTAVASAQLDTKLHQFVRAIESVARVPAPQEYGRKEKVSAREEFAQRVDSIMCDTDQKPLILDVYDARGKVEHVEVPYERQIDGDGEAERVNAIARFSRLAFTAEVLARHALCKVLMTPAVQARFATNDAIERFWKLPAGERRELWGDALPLADLLQSFQFGRAQRQIEADAEDTRREAQILRECRTDFSAGVTE